MEDNKKKELFEKMLAWFAEHYEGQELLYILVNQMHLSFEDIESLDFDISKEEFDFFEENQAFIQN